MAAYSYFKAIMSLKNFVFKPNLKPQISVEAGALMADISLGEKFEPDLLSVEIEGKRNAPPDRIKKGIAISIERFGPVQKGKAITKNPHNNEYTVVDKDVECQLQVYPFEPNMLLSLNDCAKIMAMHDAGAATGTVVGDIKRSKPVEALPENLEVTTRLSMDEFVALGKELVEADKQKSSILKNIEDMKNQTLSIDSKMERLMKQMQEFNA